MNRRITLPAAAAALTTAAVAAPLGLASSSPALTHTLASVGNGTLVVNQYIKDTMRFGASDITVRSGQTLTLVARDGEKDPHVHTCAAGGSTAQLRRDVLRLPDLQSGAS